MNTRIKIIPILFICIQLPIIGFCQKTAIYFKSNNHLLDINAKRTLDSIYRMKIIDKIYLYGYCDSIGSYEFNDKLASKRVQVVKTYFVSKGVISEKIEVKSLGERCLINNNSVEKNRRVDIELVVNSTNLNTKNLAKDTSTQNIVIINGIILNENNKPLSSYISLKDKNGKEIKAQKSSKNGTYQFTVSLNKFDDYMITYYSDSMFVSSKIINISTTTKPYKNLKTILTKLKAGKKLALQNLNFEADTSQLITASYPSLEVLFTLMQLNQSLVICIEGHVNAPRNLLTTKINKPYAVKQNPKNMNAHEFNLWLSNERAKVVYNYLIEKGINANRMTYIGMGASRMIYPNASNNEEMTANRRVVIKIIEYK